MNADPPTASELLSLFTLPIDHISQAMWKYSHLEDHGPVIRASDGYVPVIAINFVDDLSTALFIAATHSALKMRLSTTGDSAAVMSLVREIDLEGLSDPDDFVGFFDLDAVASPVAGWDCLKVTAATVVSSKIDETVLGLSLSVNLGVRMGFFVSEQPGIAMAFNDNCDVILAKARIAEQRDTVVLRTMEFPGKRTPFDVASVDWYDWLSKRKSL